MRIGVFFIFVFCLSSFGNEASKQDTADKEGKSGFTTVKVGKFVFSCKVEAENLVAEASYPTTGWVGVGFNPKEMMKGGNFILGALINGQPVLSDDFGATEYSHVPDTAAGGKNNLISGQCQTEKGTTTIFFTIPLNSGDTKDIVLEKGKTINLVLAAGKKPDLKTKHSDLKFTTIKIEK